MSVAEGGWGPIRLGEWHRYGYGGCALCPFRPVWNSHVNWTLSLLLVLIVRTKCGGWVGVDVYG
jgi:hypothetical protein